MSMMHLIYNHAVFTIVAAAGDDSSYGIAGISKDRITQPTAEIDGMTLVSTLPDPQKAVQASKWMTRAWVGIISRVMRTNLIMSTPGLPRGPLLCPTPHIYRASIVFRM